MYQFLPTDLFEKLELISPYKNMFDIPINLYITLRRNISFSNNFFKYLRKSTNIAYIQNLLINWTRFMD